MSENHLKAWRRKRFVSQSELAVKAGVSKLTVTRLESGRPTRPHPRTVRKLAMALDVRPEQIFDFGDIQEDEDTMATKLTS